MTAYQPLTAVGRWAHFDRVLGRLMSWGMGQSNDKNTFRDGW